MIDLLLLLIGLMCGAVLTLIGLVLWAAPRENEKLEDWR